MFVAIDVLERDDLPFPRSLPEFQSLFSDEAACATVAEAYGGLGVVAVEAGIRRESLYLTLSPKGNPTLKTLLAVLRSVGLRPSVEPESHVHA